MFGVLALVLVYVSISYAVNHNTNCYFEGDSKGYDGNIRQTMNGVKCLNWAACPEYGSPNLRDQDFPEGSVTAASNYCRDPDARGAEWCVIGVKGYRCTWRVCDINKCNADCYFKGQSKEYRGYITQTQGGIKCLNWNDARVREYKHTINVNFPEKSVDDAANFCRDPDASGTPWCFSADNHVDNCTVPVCSIGAN